MFTWIWPTQIWYIIRYNDNFEAIALLEADNYVEFQIIIGCWCAKASINSTGDRLYHVNQFNISIAYGLLSVLCYTTIVIWQADLVILWLRLCVLKPYCGHSFPMPRHWRNVIFDIAIHQTHDDVIKWKHFPRNWPFVRGIHRSRWIPHTKASDAELWCFLWSASEQTVE